MLCISIIKLFYIVFYHVLYPERPLCRTNQFKWLLLWKHSLLFLCHNYPFTMVEENVEIWLSEMLQNGVILLFAVNPSPWLKEILTFDFLNAPEWSNFIHLLSIILYHGWRKFWNLAIWNSLEWLNLSPKYIPFLHHGWRKFWNLAI